MAWTSFDSNNELWTEINTLADALDDAANLTALERARVAQINALSYWNWGDVNDFCEILKKSMLRKTGTTD
jgi:transglutaminase/protease-like cytokinesis protein 3